MSGVLDLGYLLRLARDTVSDPREGARAVMALNLPGQALWLSFALVITVSLLMGEVVSLLLPPPEDGPLTGGSPIVLGLVQAGFLFLLIHAMTHIGRLFGGTGTFAGALVLMIWLQFVFLLVQIGVALLLLVMPPLGALVTVFALGLFLWLLVNFIAELHGFESLMAVFVMTMLSFVAMVFALSIVLSVLGLTMPNAVWM